MYYHRMWVQLSTTCSNYRSSPMGELLVAVNHNQPRTMASETVDPIDWSHPPPSTYCTLQCGLQITRLAALSQPWTCDIRFPDQRTAGAATQGMCLTENWCYEVGKAWLCGHLLVTSLLLCIFYHKPWLVFFGVGVSCWMSPSASRAPGEFGGQALLWSVFLIVVSSTSCC